ncbi:hypothetical protein PHJA_000903700 [Phtheirospermum japonicum]|uniref:Uncharacterized protein n=1 Tax=Phtheirospermum japonicum TaxID=374723 RepID=A0A830BJ18_9LAMI|nr:hypothetical protein PHJA_000903700 [Phtheirospermum japonicum]
MESPHNAVLLLCSSHDNNCRAYMCATGPQLSNCLDQYKKAHGPLLCPLCRGEVKGWAVVEPARKYFDLKKRACVRENCSFVGTYREIKKHVKTEHPFVCPREVDPTHAEKWKKFEEGRDISDVVSVIRSTMPGAIVIGDYVVENGFYSGGDGFFRWSGPAFSLGSRSTRRGVSRMARLHERLLFGTQMGRLGR